MSLSLSLFYRHHKTRARVPAVTTKLPLALNDSSSVIFSFFRTLIHQSLQFDQHHQSFPPARCNKQPKLLERNSPVTDTFVTGLFIPGYLEREKSWTKNFTKRILVLMSIWLFSKQLPLNIECKKLHHFLLLYRLLKSCRVPHKEHVIGLVTRS